MFGDVLRYKA